MVPSPSFSSLIMPYQLSSLLSSSLSCYHHYYSLSSLLASPSFIMFIISSNTFLLLPSPSWSCLLYPHYTLSSFIITIAIILIPFSYHQHFTKLLFITIIIFHIAIIIISHHHCHNDLPSSSSASFIISHYRYTRFLTSSPSLHHHCHYKLPLSSSELTLPISTFIIILYHHHLLPSIMTNITTT